MRQAILAGPFGNISYWISGNGEDCLVFTHGATMDHGLFVPQIEHFEHRWKVIVWDVPAHGQSRPYYPFSLNDAANRMAEILDAEDITDAHLVGQSMGGYISQIFCKRYPGRVRSLTTIGSTPLSNTYYSRLDRWLLSIAPGVLKLMPHSYLIKAIANQVAITPQAKDYARSSVQTYSTKEIAVIMKGVYDAVRSFGDEAIAPPAMLITHGDQDRTGKVQSYCRSWSEAEGWPLVVIKNAAHNCNMDNPEEFNRVFLGFLEEL